MIMNDEMEEMGDKVMAFFIRGLYVWRHDNSTSYCVLYKVNLCADGKFIEELQLAGPYLGYHFGSFERWYILNMPLYRIAT